MNILKKIIKHCKKEKHSVSTLSSTGYVYGHYLERFLEFKFEKDIKKLNQRSAQVMRYKYRDMSTFGVPINGYKFVVKWKPTVYMIPKTYK